MSSVLREQAAQPRSSLPPNDHRLPAQVRTKKPSGARRRAAVLVLGVALHMPALSGCALAARVLATVEAIDMANDLMADAPDRGSMVRTDGSTPLATITGTGGSGLRLNGRPGGDRLAVLPDGASVTVRCRADGPERDGPFGSTSVWLQVLTPAGEIGYMSGAYLDLDTDQAGVQPCPAPDH